MNYAQKLKDPRWQRLRLEAMESAGWKCVHCEATDKTLNVHHKHYIKGREPWEYSLAMLLVLCDDCHDEIHKGDESLAHALAISHFTPAQLAMFLEGTRAEDVDAHWFGSFVVALVDAVLNDGDQEAKLFLAGILARFSLGLPDKALVELVANQMALKLEAKG